MAPSKKPPGGSPFLLLVFGNDDFTVKERAREVYSQWTAELGGLDHEIVDGGAANSGEAIRALGRLREGLQTLPFFGSGKVIWLKNCNFLGTDRTSSAASVSETVAGMAEELKSFEFGSVRLLISAGEVDKRKVFYKTLERLGTVEAHAGLSAADRDWAGQAETWALKAVHGKGKQISDEALAELVSRVGPNLRQLGTEIEKLDLYSGSRQTIEFGDVGTVCIRNKTARAFALGDAVGDRDLPRVLKCLDEALWEVKLDPQASEIGLLYGLISKVRALLLLKEMMREGWVRADSDYNRFKDQLTRVPGEQMPQDKRFNPLAMNAYMLYKALPQARRYSEAELVKAMELLLQCNQRLVSSSLEESLVLQQALVQIVGIGNTTQSARAPG